MGERVLASGQWLGQENRVSRLVQRRRRWVMYDTTGAEYHQLDYPNGFLTWDVAPWPYNHAGPGKLTGWPVLADHDQETHDA